MEFIIFFKLSLLLLTLIMGLNYCLLGLLTIKLLICSALSIYFLWKEFNMCRANLKDQAITLHLLESGVST